jgi:hypothetical protein
VQLVEAKMQLLFHIHTLEVQLLLALTATLHTQLLTLMVLVTKVRLGQILVVTMNKLDTIKHLVQLILQVITHTL